MTHLFDKNTVFISFFISVARQLFLITGKERSLKFNFTEGICGYSVQFYSNSHLIHKCDISTNNQNKI